jgi:hypothetical protein
LEAIFQDDLGVEILMSLFKMIQILKLKFWLFLPRKGAKLHLTIQWIKQIPSSQLGLISLHLVPVDPQAALWRENYKELHGRVFP